MRFYTLISLVLVIALLSGCAGTKKGCCPGCKDTEIEITIKDVEGFHFLYYEITGPYEIAWSGFPKLMVYLQENQIDFGPYAAGIYLDDPMEVAAEECRSEVGFMIKAPFDATGDFKYKKIDDFKAVSSNYTSYDQIEGRYEAIMKYMDENKLEFAGPPIEIHKGDGKNVDADIMVPIK